MTEKETRIYEDALKEKGDVQPFYPIDAIVDSVHQSIIEQTNNVFIEGLKNHGHEFESQSELIHFAKTRCRAERFHTGVTVYYADEKPYLEMTEKFELKQEGDTFKATSGKYRFIAKT